MEKEELFAIIFEFSERLEDMRKMIYDFENETSLTRFESACISMLQASLEESVERFDAVNRLLNK